MPSTCITIALNDHNYHSKNEKVYKYVMLPRYPLPVKLPITGSDEEYIGRHAKNDLGTEHEEGWSGSEKLRGRIIKGKTYYELGGTLWEEVLTSKSSSYSSRETLVRELCHAFKANEVRYIASVEPMSADKILKRPTRPTLTVTESQEAEEGFAALIKYGTGITTDEELINQAITTAFTEDMDAADKRRYPRNKTASTGRYCFKRNGERSSKSGRRKGSKEVGSGKYFLWRDWRIDGSFLQNFSDYLQRIVSKWSTHTKLKEESKMLEALLKENEENVNGVSTSKSIHFFRDVFMKYLYIKSKFPNRSMDQMVEELKNHHALNVRESSADNPSLALKEKEDVQRNASRKETQSYGWFEKMESLSGHKKQTDPPSTIESNSTVNLTSRTIVSGTDEGKVRQKRVTRAIENEMLEKLVKNSQIIEFKTVNSNEEDVAPVRQCGNVANEVITEELIEVTLTGKENTVEEYVPTEEEIKEEMEVREFGEYLLPLPKTIRSGESLEGRNKSECDLCEDNVMVALDCLLEKIRSKGSGERSFPAFKKCSCMKKRKRKMKSSDMEYKPSYYRKNNLFGDLEIRKSSRLKGNQSGLAGRICQVDQQDLNDETFPPEQIQAGSEDSKEDWFVSKPPRAVINDHYLKKRSEFDPSDQADTKIRYTQQKITKFLRHQKKKANRQSNRKYSGFQHKTVSGEDSVELAGGQTEKVMELRRAQISKEECDILDDLLNDLNSEDIEKSSNVSVLPNFYGIRDAFYGDAINEFEELQTMGENSAFTLNFDEIMDI